MEMCPSSSANRPPANNDMWMRPNSSTTSQIDSRKIEQHPATNYKCGGHSKVAPKMPIALGRWSAWVGRDLFSMMAMVLTYDAAKEDARVKTHVYWFRVARKHDMHFMRFVIIIRESRNQNRQIFDTNGNRMSQRRLCAYLVNGHVLMKCTIFEKDNRIRFSKKTIAYDFRRRPSHMIFRRKQSYTSFKEDKAMFHILTITWPTSSNPVADPDSLGVALHCRFRRGRLPIRQNNRLGILAMEYMRPMWAPPAVDCWRYPFSLSACITQGISTASFVVIKHIIAVTNGDETQSGDARDDSEGMRRHAWWTKWVSTTDILLRSLEL